MFPEELRWFESEEAQGPAAPHQARHVGALEI